MSFWRRRRDHPWGGAATPPSPPPGDCRLMKEDGVSFLLLEDGSNILGENCFTPPNRPNLLLESGSNMLLETGGLLLIS